MSTITKKRIQAPDNIGGAAYGNAIALLYKLNVGSTGIFTDSDKATAVAIADVVRLGKIPAGTTLLDALVIISTTMTAASTMKLGFAYVDSSYTPPAGKEADDDFFFVAGAVMTTAATLRSNGIAAPIKIERDAYLIMTMAGAAQAKASVTHVVVNGIIGGPY